MTGNAALSAEYSTTSPNPSLTSNLPAYVPRFERAKPVIAVVAENHFTELTDYVIPYGVLSASGVADVCAIATQAGPIRMLPALHIEPQATLAEFDAQFPEGADYVVVPAVLRNKDSVLLEWISNQAQKGATLVGVCDGVWVLAHAGLLNGRQGVGHWFSFKRLERKFPDTQWLRNTRYIADGNVITTTGVTASIPVSVALVEAIAGREQAASLAQAMGIQNWSPVHQSERFKLTAKHLLTAVTNGLSFWLHEKIGIPISSGVDEIALSLMVDTYSRTYRSQVLSLALSKAPVVTKRGLVVIPDSVQNTDKAVNRIVELRSDLPPIASLDASLQEIGQRYGAKTAAFVALQLEYEHQ